MPRWLKGTNTSASAHTATAEKDECVGLEKLRLMDASGSFASCWPGRVDSARVTEFRRKSSCSVDVAGSIPPDKSCRYGSLLVNMRVAEWLVLRPRETGCIEGGNGIVVEMNGHARNRWWRGRPGGLGRFKTWLRGTRQNETEFTRGRRAGDDEGRVGSYKSGGCEREGQGRSVGRGSPKKRLEPRRERAHLPGIGNSQKGFEWDL